MGTNQLVVGFSPFGAPSHNPIYPFDQIYDKSINLAQASNNDIKKCDLLLLWGGSDISPMLYGEEPILNSGPHQPSNRDIFEWELIQKFSEYSIPIIGVCRGAQLLCAAAGGKLIQHTNGHTGTTHKIKTFDNLEFEVSSDHHQMLYPYGYCNHELLAWMEEPLSSTYQGKTAQNQMNLFTKQVKEPEVVFFNDLNALAIQCHPEWHSHKDPFNNWIDDIILERFFD